MALSLPTASRSAMLSGPGLLPLLDAGTGPGVIEIRSGTRPSADAAATGTLLATVTLAATAFTESNGVGTLADPAAVVAVADGTATWFRALDSDDNAVMDGDVSDTSGDGDLKLATTSLTTGLSVDVTGGAITMPAS